MESILSSKSISHDNSANDCVPHSDAMSTANTNKISGSNNNSSSNVPGLKFAANHSAIANGQQPQHQLVSANSFELNGMTTSSLSEDSGLPPTTNNSISSGDSSRFGLCKSAFELIESDGEVSQFDSLDTFSDGGMSTENFNTMKKVRLAPIDPPPEFQDSPQTTLLRSPAIQTFSLQLSQHILLKAMTICSAIIAASDASEPTMTRAKSLECLEKTCANCIYDSVANNDDYIFQPTERHSFDNYFHEYSHHHIYDIYASDSMLNRPIDNIYDVPCDESTNVSTSIESLAEPSMKALNCSDSPKSNERVQRKCVKERQRENQLKMEGASEIHDYDLYYRKESNRKQGENSLKPFALTSSFIEFDAIAKYSKNTKAYLPLQRNGGGTFNANTNTSTTSSSTTTSATTLQRRKNPSILYSPLHYHASSNLSTGNRPNSRNSLNSRLSSSHNSLTIATSNKADDSIFITQAMSHDALTGREISDFYNVPIDSDIYALPIDVIRPKSVASCRDGSGCGIAPVKCTSDISAKGKTSSMKTINANGNTNGSMPSLSLLKSSKAIHGRLKYVRNNKKRKSLQQNNGVDIDQVTNASSGALSKANDKRNSVSDNVGEPKHMMFDEVKRFYSNLYTNSASNGNGSIGARLKDFGTACGGITDDRVVNNNTNNNNNNNNNSVNKCAQNNNESDRNNNGNNNANGTSGGTSNSNNTIINSGSSSYSTNNNNILINNNIINSNNKNGSSNLTSNNFNNYHVNNNNNNCESTASAAAVTTLSSSTPSHSNASNNKVANNASKLLNSRCNTNNNKHSLNNSKSVSSSTVNSITKENEYISASAAGVTSPSLTPATKKSQFSINLNLKQKFCSIFRFRKSYHQNNGSNQRNSVADVYDSSAEHTTVVSDKKVKFSTRALPPLPPKDMKASTTESSNVKKDAQDEKTQDPMDFAANIEKVKEYGWYWGPISSEAAEKILSNEPDGSFIVRDSSDDHYIFSLTFKLNNSVRHVRIEQDQGTFSFGSCAKFKSRTIMEFIENAVESSRSGRYLFFFHRRPEHGPMRVQLTNPVSRFKHIQSLQHMCRFVIRRAVVRKDLIQTLPLPRRLLDYLSYKNCYSELVESDSSQSPTSETIANDAVAADDNTPIIINR